MKDSVLVGRKKFITSTFSASESWESVLSLGQARESSMLFTIASDMFAFSANSN